MAVCWLENRDVALSFSASSKDKSRSLKLSSKFFLDSSLSVLFLLGSLIAPSLFLLRQELVHRQLLEESSIVLTLLPRLLSRLLALVS